jgi:hypothetical protein
MSFADKNVASARFAPLRFAWVRFLPADQASALPTEPDFTVGRVKTAPNAPVVDDAVGAGARCSGPAVRSARPGAGCAIAAVSAVEVHPRRRKRWPLSRTRNTDPTGKCGQDSRERNQLDLAPPVTRPFVLCQWISGIAVQAEASVICCHRIRGIGGAVVPTCRCGHRHGG